MENSSNNSNQLSIVQKVSESGSKHVVCLYGGMSAERNVSLSSGQGVITALVNLGYKVTSIDVGCDICSILPNLAPDVVFNSLVGTYGEDGCIAGLLNILKIPYTHSGVLASALAFNKSFSKDIFDKYEIKVPKTVVVSKEEILNGFSKGIMNGSKTNGELSSVHNEPLERPFIIKPLCQGSSIGVRTVYSGDNFNFSTDYEFKYGDKVIVQEFIRGREINVGVLDGVALGLLEIKLKKGQDFFDYESKYTEGEAEHVVNPKLPEHIRNGLMITAEKIYSAFGVRALCRVEFMYSEERGEFFVLELNTHPGMTPLSTFPEIAASVGINYEKLVKKLVDLAQFD